MIQLKRILAPTDFSEPAKNALGYACTLARAFGAAVHLLHVLQDFSTRVPEPGLMYNPLAERYLAELRESARKQLEALPDAETANGLAVARHLRQGHPFVEIVRYAREAEVDLIVLGTHGRSGLAHILIGSVAEKVVRKAPCPVLTVRPHEHEFVLP